MNLILVPMLWPVTRWARHSQRQACRNAMVASTALSVDHRERVEVQAYCETLLARRRPRAGHAAASG